MISLKYAVVTSKDNIAGMNIVSFLENKLPKNIALHILDGHICYLDKANEIDADVIIFASTHKSKVGNPALTTHAIGNWGKAELGGKDKSITPTNSFLLKNYLNALQKQKEEKALDYEVCLEVTHHGPSLNKPTVFIELGSSEKQWRDKKAAEAVANAILSSTSTEGDYKSAIAIGGGHYCPEFTKLVLRTEWALGHICPMYALQDFNENMLQKAVDATFPKPEAIILDWKGLKREKQRIDEFVSEFDLPVFRVRKLLG